MRVSRNLVFGMALLSVGVTLSGCATQTLGLQIYRGRYSYNFENAAFTPVGSSEHWCVDSSKLKGAELPASGDDSAFGSAEIVIKGVRSAKGHYCNLGAYPYFLDVVEVVGIANKQRSAR